MTRQSIIAARTGLPLPSVEGCVRLLEEGNTVPFIARYRKEVTRSLDEVQIRSVHEAFEELKKLEARKQTILTSIEGQGKLTPELKRSIETCWDSTELEDLYLPFKPSKKSRAEDARKAGLEPLALKMAGREVVRGTRLDEAQRFVGGEGRPETVEDALAGARDILAEWICSTPSVRKSIREATLQYARLVSKQKSGVGEEAEAFRDYFDREERIVSIAPHRFLAICRGRDQGALTVSLRVDADRMMSLVRSACDIRAHPVFRSDFIEAVEDGYKRLLWPSTQREVLARVKEKADRKSVLVFENNLRSLLMTPPVRGKRILAADPGFRNGCKLAVVDETGRVLDTATIYPHEPQRKVRQAEEQLVALAVRHRVSIVAVGDGTAHRETMALMKNVPWKTKPEIIAVREAGASVYSASPVATAELPDLDVTLRGAVSIARRHQDALAELVKIEPRSLGVGQYQHDVDQKLLEGGLEAVVEECVNRVGVELNTASPSLLARVAGIGPKIADAVVAHRDAKGPFRERNRLLRVPGLGPSRFTQCAGFLRVRDSANPLDATGIHPERYEFVRRLASLAGKDERGLLADREAVAGLRKNDQLADSVGRQTFADILDELEKPGHDPRGVAEEFRFADGIDSMDDLSEGMVLPGRVTSITDFGAFVDIGVHRDGLVHISQMADRRIASPFEVCKPAMVVRVKVVEVDRRRNRIGLSMKPSELSETKDR